jgi:DNA polymerase III alpha subunit
MGEKLRWYFSGILMRVSPHTHLESPLTGSTIATMVDRAKELGRTHICHTDHGHLSSCFKTYLKAKEKGLKFIPGLEIYFKDSECPFASGTGVERCKYFTATIYCQDQKAYQELCRLISKETFPTLEIYQEKQQLWSWKELEHMSKFNVTLVLGGVHCMVGKSMLAGRADVGENVFIMLKRIFGDKLFTAIVCETWTKKWNSVVEVELEDGTKVSCLASDTVSTDRARRMKAMDLIEREGHKVLKSLSSGGIVKNVNLGIIKVKLHKGFLPLPGGDALLKVNKFLKALSAKHDVRAIVSDYAYYANKEDKIVQTMRLEGTNKLQPNFYMKSEEEVRDYLKNTLGADDNFIQNLFDNLDLFIERFAKLEFEYEWRLADVGENPLLQAMAIIRENGRMRWDDPVYVDRLKEELNVIAKNPVKDLTSYFLPIRDVLNHYKENGLLVGPGRGSSGGSLFCYLLGITQVNPFEYDLPFSRFFSMDRIMMKELPDIDVDLEERTLLVGHDGKSGYLYNRYGDKAAQISTRTTIRLKSAIKDTNRYFKGKVEPEIEIFSKGLPPPPQGVNDHQFVFGYEDSDGEHIPGLIEQSEHLQKYATDRPEEWAIVSKAMGLTRAFSKHASSFVLSDVPIKDVAPVKDGNITQYEARECEAAGLIKYDFLVINQLKDIRVCLDLINKKNNETNTVGDFIHNGKKTYIWDLPEIPEVFKSVWSGACETIFQINTKSMVPYVMEILPSSIMDLATILALVRPGPMDFIDENTGRNMVQEYILRRRGESLPDIKELSDLLPETYGIICFQEDLNKIARDLAGFPGEKAEKLRKNMSKKKMKALLEMKPAFIEGAKNKVSEEVAESIWDRMITFGRYGFSVIHACFLETQLIRTKNGFQTMRDAFDTKSDIAYFKNGEIFYEQPTRWFDQGEKEVLEITLEDGSMIACTEDHKFLNDDGSWSSARECIDRGYFYAK